MLLWIIGSDMSKQGWIIYETVGIAPINIVPLTRIEQGEMSDEEWAKFCSDLESAEAERCRVEQGDVDVTKE